MIVVDVKVIAYLLIEGQKTSLARRVRGKDSHWLLPALWRSEFLNVLALQVHHRGFNLRTAQTLWEQALELFRQEERAVDTPLALQIAAENRISGYDAQYISLAQQSGVPCVSEDRELGRKFPDRVMRMSDFVEEQ